MTPCKLNLLPINEALFESLTLRVAAAGGTKTPRAARATVALERSGTALYEESRHAYLELCHRLLSGKLDALPELTGFGYAPGEYTTLCSDCGKQFIAAMHSKTCRVCAERQLTRSVLPWAVFPNE